MIRMQGEYNLVDQPVLLTILMYEILHFAQCWTGETLKWPVPYRRDVAPWDGDVVLWGGLVML